MQRVLILLGIVAALALGTAPAGSAATGSAKVESSSCPTAPVVAYVSLGVQSEGIAAPSGAEWARGTYTRQIVIYRLGTYTFCAITRDSGSFVTEAGPSPGGTGWVGDGLTGTVTKSARSTIFYGAWRPLVPTFGSIGTSVDGNWLPLFFSWTYGYDTAWWAQLYRSYYGCFNWSYAYGVSGDITSS